MNILEEANKATGVDRRETHGHPLDCFVCTGKQWEALLEHSPGALEVRADGTVAVHFNPALVAQFQIAFKQSRMAFNPGHRDNPLDIAGYARTAEMCEEEKSRREILAELPQPVAAEERLVVVMKQRAGDGPPQYLARGFNGSSLLTANRDDAWVFSNPSTLPDQIKGMGLTPADWEALAVPEGDLDLYVIYTPLGYKYPGDHLDIFSEKLEGAGLFSLAQARWLEGRMRRMFDKPLLIIERASAADAPRIMVEETTQG